MDLARTDHKDVGWKGCDMQRYDGKCLYLGCPSGCSCCSVGELQPLKLSVYVTGRSQNGLNRVPN